MEDELDLLTQELARAVGLRGRDRTFSSPAERARIFVTKAIWTAIRLIDKHCPELAAQTAVIAREETAVRLARRNYLPDFEFAASRFVNFRADDGFGAYAGVTIPLPYKSKYDAAVAEANARLTDRKSVV